MPSITRKMPTQEVTLMAIRNGANTRASLALALGIPASSCGARVSRLIGAGLITEEGSGRGAKVLSVAKGGAFKHEPACTDPNDCDCHSYAAKASC